VCTWARRSIFQAVAHEKRSSWGRVPPHRYGRRRRWRRRRRRRRRWQRRRRRTKPGVTSPLFVYTENAREETRESRAGIISSGDAGASGYVRACRPPPPPSCPGRERARDERVRIAESMIMILTKRITLQADTSAPRLGPRYCLFRRSLSALQTSEMTLAMSRVLEYL